MALAKLPENTIITSLYCPPSGEVGRLYRKRSEEAPNKLEDVGNAQYFYTLRCPKLGDIELWGVVKPRTSGTAAETS